jgi:hypothetical protein
MRLIRSLRPAAAALMLGTAALAPAAAQSASLRPSVQLASFTHTPAPVRTVAVYRFSASSIAGLPAQVTIADSAGTLVASLRRATGRVIPMAVGVADTDILLQAATQDGLLTIVLYEQNDTERTGAVIGRWRLGEREGELRGQSTR